MTDAVLAAGSTQVLAERRRFRVLHRLAAQGRVAQLSESVVPASLIEGFGASSTYSHVLPLFGEPVRIEAPGGPNAVLQPDGTVVRATRRQVATWVAPRAGAPAGGRIERRRGASCIVAGNVTRRLARA